jgi:hypothetical protein
VGLIYLDACLLIYLAERHTRWGELVGSAMRKASEARFGISPLVKCECLVGPIKRGNRFWSAHTWNCSSSLRH